MKAVPLLCVGFLLVGSAVLANRHDSGNYSTNTKENMSADRDDTAARYEEDGTQFAVNRSDLDSWNRTNAQRDPAYDGEHFVALPTGKVS